MFFKGFKESCVTLDFNCNPNNADNNKVITEINSNDKNIYYHTHESFLVLTIWTFANELHEGWLKNEGLYLSIRFIRFIFTLETYTSV